jgi:serine/threonine protein kinase
MYSSSYQKSQSVKLVYADPAKIYCNMSPAPVCAGGQATIHTCRHPQTNKRMAVKRIVLPRSGSEKQKTMQMAMDEAKALANCQSRSIVRLADPNVYEALGSVFIIMEFISGRTLYEALLRQRRSFQEHEIVRVLKVSQLAHPVPFQKSCFIDFNFVQFG